MKIGWELENTVLVQAPCWLAWQIMCDVLHWPKTGRISLRSEADARAFGYTLKPLGLPIRVKAHITAVRDMQLLAWQGRFWGVCSDVKMRFVAEDDSQTRIVFKEKLSGLGLLLVSALFSTARLSSINQDWLAAVGREIETRARQLKGLSTLPPLPNPESQEQQENRLS